MAAEAPKVCHTLNMTKLYQPFLDYYRIQFFQIFWAKIPGFAPWPARYCSKLETIDLRKRATPKGSQVATVFLERKMKRLVFEVLFAFHLDITSTSDLVYIYIRGWVSGANIEGFKLDQIIDPSGGGLFSLKSFDSNPNYRLSIMEAVRITYSQINNDPNMSREEAAKAADVYQQITSLIHKHEPVWPIMWKNFFVCSSHLGFNTCHISGLSVENA